MKISLKPGGYVVAVSGGVDSVVLLDLLVKLQSQNPDIQLIVAHFDHGIRPGSSEDRVFVRQIAEKYKLRFFYEEGELGFKTSESTARAKRYEFLQRVVKQTKSKAIITAHHQDDLLETALINLIRGTSARGLGSLKSHDGLIRPLLAYSKEQIINYAKINNLNWREDETNNDQAYLRNYVRHSLIAKITKKQREQLLQLISSSQLSVSEMDKIIQKITPNNGSFSRTQFCLLSNDIACEVVASWLRGGGMRVDSKSIQRIVIELKTLPNQSKIQASNNRFFIIKNGTIFWDQLSK